MGFSTVRQWSRNQTAIPTSTNQKENNPYTCVRKVQQKKEAEDGDKKVKASTAVCRILSKWRGEFAKKSPWFFPIFCQTICEFFWSTSSGAAELLWKRTISMGRCSFLYKCVLMQFFNAAEWTVRRSEWFDLAPSGVPAGWLVGSLFQAYSPYQFRSWPCPGFFEVLSFGMLEIHRFVRLGFPQFWKEIQSSGDSTVNNKQLYSCGNRNPHRLKCVWFFGAFMLNFFQGKFQNNKVCYFQTNVATARLECKKKKCIHCPACVPSYNKHLFTSTFRFQSSKPVSDSFHARTWMGCCDQGTHQGGKKFKKKIWHTNMFEPVWRHPEPKMLQAFDQYKMWQPKTYPTTM